MTTGYTQTELDELQDMLEANVPGVPRPAEKAKAERVTAMRAGGTDKGVLMELRFKKGPHQLIWLNCCVATDLAAGFNVGAQGHDWLSYAQLPKPPTDAPELTPDDIVQADTVLAISTLAAPKGALVNANIEGAPKTACWYFSRAMAMELFYYITEAAERDSWWGPGYILNPRPTLN